VCFSFATPSGRPGARGAQFHHLGADGDFLAGAQRGGPFGVDLVAAERDLREQPAAHHSPEDRRERMQAARDQFAEDALLRRLGVEVEVLRVVFARESDDLLMRQGQRAEVPGHAGGEVVEGTDRVGHRG
jgi:hypothetical protein